jgi:hypothetical protein
MHILFRNVFGIFRSLLIKKFYLEHHQMKLIFIIFCFSILPAKMCWSLMNDVMQGPQSMMTYQGHVKAN